MSIQLPAIIDIYFTAARARNAEGDDDCFTDTAVIQDEGRTYTGLMRYDNVNRGGINETHL